MERVGNIIRERELDRPFVWESVPDVATKRIRQVKRYLEPPTEGGTYRPPACPDCDPVHPGLSVWTVDNLNPERQPYQALSRCWCPAQAKWSASIPSFYEVAGETPFRPVHNPPPGSARVAAEVTEIDPDLF